MSVLKMHGTGHTVYIEGGCVTDRMKGGRMDDASYAAMLDHAVIVCTDAVITQRAARAFWLARRVAEPMPGLWWIGGRRLKGELPHQSMRRAFLRETGLNIGPEWFQFRRMVEYIWASRAQEPKANGSHNLAHQFTVELSPRQLEFAAAHLDPDEYDLKFGLQRFDRARLLDSNVHPVILDLYDEVFPR